MSNESNPSSESKKEDSSQSSTDSPFEDEDDDYGLERFKAVASALGSAICTIWSSPGRNWRIARIIILVGILSGTSYLLYRIILVRIVFLRKRLALVPHLSTSLRKHRQWMSVLNQRWQRLASFPVFKPLVDEVSKLHRPDHQLSGHSPVTRTNSNGSSSSPDSPKIDEDTMLPGRLTSTQVPRALMLVFDELEAAVAENMQLKHKLRQVQMQQDVLKQMLIGSTPKFTASSSTPSPLAPSPTRSLSQI